MELLKRRETIVKNYIEAYNNFDVAGMLADLHPDVVFENKSGGHVTMTLQGIDAFRQQAEQAKHYFESRQQQIVHLSCTGDMVEVDITYKGILAVDLPGGPGQGDTIEQDGKSIFQFAHDKVIRLTDIS